MFEKIVLATDFGPVSTAATEKTLEIAKQFGSEVVLVYAIERLQALGKTPEEREKMASDHYAVQDGQARDRTAALVERFAEQGVKARLRTDVGRRWEVIVALAKEEDADLLVVGAHAVEDGEKLYMGSTAHNVFLMAPMTVLAVKETTRGQS